MKILIADKAAKVRSAIGLLLYQQPRITMTYEAADATSALDMAARHTFDIILLDWTLIKKTQPQLLKRLLALQSHTAIIALSSCPDDQQIALQNGACAFVSKGDPPECLLNAIYRCLPEEETRKSRSAFYHTPVPQCYPSLVR